MIPPTVPALRAWLADFEDRGELQVTEGARRVLDLFFEPPAGGGVAAGPARRVTPGLRHPSRRSCARCTACRSGRRSGVRCGRRSPRSEPLVRCCRPSSDSSLPIRTSCCGSGGSNPAIDRCRPTSGGSGCSVVRPRSAQSSRTAPGSTRLAGPWDTPPMAPDEVAACCWTSTECWSRPGTPFPERSRRSRWMTERGMPFRLITNTTTHTRVGPGGHARRGGIRGGAGGDHDGGGCHGRLPAAPSSGRTGSSCCRDGDAVWRSGRGGDSSTSPARPT